jgi:hypothetical protein
MQVRSWVVKKVVNEASEKFSSVKLVNGMFNVVSLKEWAKTFSTFFNLRAITLLLLIVGAVYGYGWWKGSQGKPVLFDLRGQEATIKLNEHSLHIKKDGTAEVIDKNGKVVKTITVKDIDSLSKALRPYGLKFEPIAVVGGSLGQTGAGFEGGAGISWLKYYKWNLDSFITNRGAYPLGVSYKITDNSGAGLGYGYGYKGDQRAMLYYKFTF